MGLGAIRGALGRPQGWEGMSLGRAVYIYIYIYSSLSFLSLFISLSIYSFIVIRISYFSVSHSRSILIL